MKVFLIVFGCVLLLSFDFPHTQKIAYVECKRIDESDLRETSIGMLSECRTNSGYYFYVNPASNMLYFVRYPMAIQRNPLLGLYPISALSTGRDSVYIGAPEFCSAQNVYHLGDFTAKVTEKCIAVYKPNYSFDKGYWGVIPKLASKKCDTRMVSIDALLPGDGHLDKMIIIGESHTYSYADIFPYLHAKKFVCAIDSFSLVRMPVEYANTLQYLVGARVSLPQKNGDMLGIVQDWIAIENKNDTQWYLVWQRILLDDLK